MPERGFFNFRSPHVLQTIFFCKTMVSHIVCLCPGASLGTMQSNCQFVFESSQHVGRPKLESESPALHRSLPRSPPFPLNTLQKNPPTGSPLHHKTSASSMEVPRFPTEHSALLENTYTLLCFLPDLLRTARSDTLTSASFDGFACAFCRLHRDPLAPKR